MDPMASIKQTFFQECEEQLSELESGLMSLEEGNHDPENVNAVFRAVHSIKGGASAFGFDSLVEFVHVFETTLDLLRSGKLSPDQSTLVVLLKAADVLNDLVRAARTGGDVGNDNSSESRAELQALCGQSELAGAESEHADVTQDAEHDIDFAPIAISLEDIFDDGDLQHRYTINFTPKASLYAKANETLRIIRELSALGETKVSCCADKVPLLPELDPEGAYLTWKITLSSSQTEEKIRDAFEFVLGDCDLEIERLSSSEEASPANKEGLISEEILISDPVVEAPQSEARVSSAPLPQKGNDPGKNEKDQSQHPATIRVDLDKVDRLIDLVGELVITQAMLSQRVQEAGLPRASSVMIGLDELEQLTRDIQDSVMAIRAQPVKTVFQRMARVVREVSALTKKPVRLVTDGEGTEVDKTVIEKLTDPLTHMIRNAVDHGVEPSDIRLAAGKPEESVLRLSAMHRSGRIVIEIADDGAGINRQRVREIAVNKGLIPADVSLTEEEVDNLIFLPGFSTAATATALSGRGVGMDVVKRAIQALRGRISIISRPGRGSTFSMSLPLTLAVLDGMVVSVADQTFVIPINAVIETLQPNKDNLHYLPGGAMVVKNRDTFIPVIDIGKAFCYRNETTDPTSQVALLTESEDGGRCALLVDGIQGQRQVVIKGLESNYGHVYGVAAATILGDGRVALIIDIDAMISGLRINARSDEPAGVTAV